MSFTNLKQNAMNMLSGKKKNSAIMILVFFIITIVLNTILNSFFPGKETLLEFSGMRFKYINHHPIKSILETFISIFFSLGMSSYFLKIARGEETDLSEIFSKSNLVLKAFVTSIITGLFILLGTIAFVIPGIVLALGYSMILYIYIDNPDIGFYEVTKKSREIMKGHKFEYFCLILSFIGWIILSILTCGLLLFWLIPYISVTTALFYDEIK